MDCLQDRVTKRFWAGLRSKHMSNAKHYEWLFVSIFHEWLFADIFQRKVVKRYSLFGFEGSNLQNNLHLEN